MIHYIAMQTLVELRSETLRVWIRHICSVCRSILTQISFNFLNPGVKSPSFTLVHLQDTHTHTIHVYKEANVHVFKLWKKTGESRENPCSSMQSPHIKLRAGIKSRSSSLWVVREHAHTPSSNDVNLYSKKWSLLSKSIGEVLANTEGSKSLKRFHLAQHLSQSERWQQLALYVHVKYCYCGFLLM